MKLGRSLMTGFGLGYAPVASGTFGSAGGAAVAWVAWVVLYLTGRAQGRGFDLVLAVLTLLASWGCVYWGPWAVRHFGARARKAGDPGEVVLDEFAGQFVSLIGFAITTPKAMVLVFALQFFLFRLFDVLKPPPARQFERLAFGWGILLDDLAAGVYANIIGHIAFRFLLPLHS